MNINRLKSSVAAIALGLVTSLAASSASAQTALPAGVTALLDAAAREGVVSLFVSTDARTAEDEARLEAGLLADLGIAIDIRLVSGSPDPVYAQQLVQQHGAGVEVPIDLMVTVPTLLDVLNDAGAIAATDWQALDVNPDDLAANITVCSSPNLPAP